MILYPLEYLYSLHSFGSKLGLERVQDLMNKIDKPYTKFKSIHVAGTNGKGSVCSFLATIFQKAGYKVGLYTSPHLVSFNERIQINGKHITDEELATLVAKIKNTLGDAETTFFEFTTAVAFEHFVQNNVDIDIIEVGLGGRLDATNVITPLVSVITSISKDHTRILGETNEKIAGEKAGIIKSNVPVVLGKNDSNVIDVIESVCTEKNSPLSLVTIPHVTSPNDPLESQSFSYKNENYTINLLGEHQINNACTAIETCSILDSVGLRVSNEALKEGLQEAQWPGRLDIIQSNPLVLVDGAHNVSCCEKLSQFLHKLPQKKIMILGFSKDKEIEKMVSILAPLADTIILTESNHKPASVDDIEQFCIPYGNKVLKFPKVQDAIQKAISLVKKDDMIVIAGSLYLVGDVLTHKTLFHNVFK
ncbi:bifunctional folylpolyglutamate synthase/dihydrofolate synthase [Candidatus Woesearchaeota archaeon]|nr:bifunctional folylpolyglutamate synthase/dihydrofolate synthase [Candidatus Woesearchaeota archaeon]